MNFEKYLILAWTVSSCFGSMLSCTSKNTTCEELQSPNGFKYLHECPDKSRIVVTHKETKIAYANFGKKSKQHQYLREGMNFSDKAFFMRECMDVHIKCVSPYEEKYVRDSCITYTILEPKQHLASTDFPLGLILGVLVAVVVPGGIAGLCWCFCTKKRAQSDTPRLSCCVCNTKGISKTGEAGDQRPTDGSSAHGSADSTIDVAVNQNAQNKSLEIQSEIHLSETEENRNNSDLESNVHPEADGEVPKSLSEDFIIIDETQSSENENKTVPGRTSRHRSMHRHLRGDPGGVTYNKAEHSVRIGDPQRRQTLADRTSEEDVTEGAPLLPSPGAAIQFSDMTGEAETQVDRAASPPDQSRKLLSTGQ